MGSNIRWLYINFFKGVEVVAQDKYRVRYRKNYRNAGDIDLPTNLDHEYVWREEEEWKRLFERFIGPNWTKP